MKMYSEYRAQARETLKGRWNEMALLTLLMAFIAAVFESPSLISATFDLIWMVPFGAGTQTLAALLLVVPMFFAFYNLLLVYARGEQPADSYLSALFKDFASNWTKYVLSGLLIVIFVILISIPTLCIGGIILGLAYTMVPFIIHDNPDMSAGDVLKTSRLMMRGHKWQLFVLELTFIGWAILCILSCGIGFLWLTPYQYAAIAHFYEDVKAEYAAVQAVQEAQEVKESAQKDE